MSTSASASDTVAGRPPSSRISPSERWVRIGIVFAIALAIVGAAWVVGGREDFSDIGRGGVNTSLLPKVGQAAPDFTTNDLNGNLVSLSDFKGQPVWLNFWGSWCPPCRSEMPDVQAAYAQLAPKGLVLLAISQKETPQQAAAFAAKNNVTFTILSDQYLKNTGATYPVLNYPTHIFIDSSGIVQRVVLSDLSAEEALQYGEELVAASNQS